MHVWAIASARATIGGPSLESRTPCRNAWFHRRTTLPPGGTPRALDASLGNASDAAPAPAAARKRRRESGCSRASRRDLLGPGELERRDGEVKSSDEIARAASSSSPFPFAGLLPQRKSTPLVLTWEAASRMGRSPVDVVRGEARDPCVQVVVVDRLAQVLDHLSGPLPFAGSFTPCSSSRGQDLDVAVGSVHTDPLAIMDQLRGAFHSDDCRQAVFPCDHGAMGHQAPPTSVTKPVIATNRGDQLGSV